MTDASTGWGGECHLSSDDSPANYFELVEVVSFGLPDDEVDEVEATHLKSPDKRKEFIAGLIDGGTVPVTINWIPGSPTDLAIRNARDARDTRAIKFGIPDISGDVIHEIETFAFLKGFARGPVEAGAKLSATVNFRITGAQTESDV